MAGQNINFTRSRNGYETKEVDAVIIELQRQILDLKQRNDTISNVVGQYDVKVRELAENTKQLQRERVQESLRITNLMTASAKMAEQTERDALHKASEITEYARRETARIVEAVQQEAKKTLESARREAEKIRGQAQVDFVAVLAALTKLNENTQMIRESNEEYISSSNRQLSEIDRLINNALNGVPIESIPQAETLPQTEEAEPEKEEEEAAQQDPSPESDPYEDFVQKMEKIGKQPHYPKG